MKKLFSLACMAIVAVTSGQAVDHSFNGAYRGSSLEHIAFPIGGLGAGMFCLEGSGAISQFSIRNHPDLFNEPPIFAAISVKGQPAAARVLEGPVPAWKKFGPRGSGFGQPGATWGLARFRNASFTVRLPFAEIALSDPAVPVKVNITGWSPFIPTDADNSSLPVGALEYRLTNTTAHPLELVFSFNSAMFGGFGTVRSVAQGAILTDSGSKEAPERRADLAMVTDDPATVVDHTWFRSGWFDPLTMTWNRIRDAKVEARAPSARASGVSLQVPFTLQPGASRTIRVFISWYCPETRMRFMADAHDAKDSTVRDASVDLPSKFYKPWYSSRFKNINEIINYWQDNYTSLRKNSDLFTQAFYRSSLPPEVLEAVAANLTILKSPTALRQYDGRFWGWEGSGEDEGSCPGSCEHVWNYAQAMSHVFPALERTMRETELNESQNADGQQMFRAALPIRPQAHNFYAAADGQPGGIMKIYRDWRISGDSVWIAKLYPRVHASMDYCIRNWDPRHTGTFEEPHHNTYDIEFWGAEGMCTGMYLGALEAFISISEYLGQDAALYKDLLQKGREAITTKLFNGQYFYQRIQWKGLSAADPLEAAKGSLAGAYSDDARALLQQEGPKYQYGDGCLSDGAIGAWMAQVCGLPAPYDTSKIHTHLLAVYKNNFVGDLSAHSNPQRPTYALGKEGGLLLCSWPKNDKLSLPFPYSDEVWTGIEYEVASHLIFAGEVKKGLEIVRAARKRYDGHVRNPFDEYECGHWYARAMSSYALLEALTGVRYDAVTGTLYVHSRVGNFTGFLSTDSGFGDVVYKNGKASLQVVYGKIPVRNIVVQ